MRELGLQEEPLARHLGDRLADSRLEVMLALVGGIDADEAFGERELHERARALFFPGRAIEEGRERVSGVSGHLTQLSHPISEVGASRPADKQWSEKLFVAEFIIVDAMIL